ncbi:MAG: TetR/AcrR family transcriptional regulator [Gemmatimonadales bacterium]
MARVAGRSFTREEVTEAAWRVILRDGLHKASVRAIAAELGATTGVVTYHFRDKADLLLMALDRLGAAVIRNIDAALEGATGVDRIRRILSVTLPLTPREVSGLRLWISFVGIAMSNKRLREEHQRRLDLMHDRLTTELLALRASGAIPDAVDADLEADALIALSDGIGLGFLLRPKDYPPERQWTIVEGYLEGRYGLANGGPPVPLLKRSR